MTDAEKINQKKEEKLAEESPKKETKKPSKKSSSIKKEKPTKEATQVKKVIFTVGKRKVSVARCTIRPGVGRILVNSTPVELIQNEVVRLMISEPILVIGSDKWKAYDFDINLSGGGVMGQAEAARQSIARGLVELFGGDVKAKFLEYNRAFLAYDPRRTEPHKSPRSSQGPRRYKQRSKR